MMFRMFLNYLKVVNESHAIMSIRLSVIRMATWNDIRSDSLPKVLLKRTTLTTKRPFHQSLRRIPLKLLWH